MSKQGLNCKQVSAIFIEVGAKSVPERMAGQMMREAKFRLFGRNKLVDRVRNHVLIRAIHFWEQPAGRPAMREPVGSKDLQGKGGKDGIAVRTRLGMADMDAHGGAGNVLIAEGTDLADTEASGIHEGEDRLVFEVGKGVDKIPGFFLRRDIRQIGIKPAQGKLGGIPRLM